MARRTGRTKARTKQPRWTVEKARQLLTAWERSGLTMAAFCRKRGIRTRRLYWWRSRLEAWSQEPTGQPSTVATAGHQLVEAVVVPSVSSTLPTSAVTLHLRGGDKIEVLSPEDVEVEWLVRLTRGLSASAEIDAR